MKRWQKIALVAALCIAGLLLASWASTHSSSYEVCKEERDGSGDKTPEFGKQFAYFIVCEGVTIDANGELITALGTIAIAVFTLTLWLVTGNTLKLANAEFISTHRPRIRVRLLKINPIQLGQRIAIDFTLVNVGDSDAIDISGCLNLAVIVGPLQGPVSELKFMETFSYKGTSLPAGGHIIVRIPTKAVPEVAWGRPLSNLDQRVTIEGRIGYQDARGVDRLTGFLRRSSDDPNRFFPVGDSTIRADYEYED